MSPRSFNFSQLRGEMRSGRILSRSVILLAAAFVVSLPGQQIQTGGNGIPKANPYLKMLLNDARQKWRKDAIITKVQLEGVQNVAGWLGVELYSPSNGGIMNVEVGGPNNGAETYAQATAANGIHALTAPLPPGVNVDLPDAIASIRKAGLNGPLGASYLGMAGASGTAPILAWTVHVSSGGFIEAPIFVDASSGKFIPWKRAMDPPNGSDAQIAAAWNALFHRNDNQNSGQGEGINSPAYKAMECVAMIQEGLNGC
jgi:hypothetical protein